VLGQGATPLLQDLDLRDNRIGLTGMQAIATALSAGRFGLPLQRLRIRLEDNPGDPRVAYDALGRQLHLLDRPTTTWCTRSSKRAALARIYFWGPPRSPSIITLQFDNSINDKGRRPFEYMEGMMIWLQCPFLDGERMCLAQEHHPAFITSAADEPILEVTLAVMPSSHAWSQQVAKYLCMLDPHATGEVELVSRNMTTGEASLGKVVGPDGRPFFHLSSPRFSRSEFGRSARSPAHLPIAPTQCLLWCCAPLRWALGGRMATWVSSFRTLVLVSTGVGCTPQASLLKGLVDYRWKKGFTPHHLHFLWVVDYMNLLEYKWLLVMLPELKRHQITHNMYYGGSDQASQLEVRINQLEEQSREGSSSAPVEDDLARLRSAWSEASSNSRTLNITIFLTGHPARRVAGAARHADLQPSRMEAARPGSCDEVINSLLAVVDPTTGKPHIGVRSGRPSWHEELGRLPAVVRRSWDKGTIGVLACGMPAGSTLKHACQAHQLPDFYDQVL